MWQSEQRQAVADHRTGFMSWSKGGALNSPPPSLTPPLQTPVPNTPTSAADALRFDGLLYDYLATVAAISS